MIIEHHYLKSATLVGENLRYVATCRGEWLALMAFCAGSFNLRYREQFIGWTPELRRRRLALVVNHARFLVLPDCHYPNLPSRLLKLVLSCGVKSGRWLGMIAVADKSNEIPAAQALLDRQDVEGKVVAMDALHTQDLTAQKIVFERGGDYVFTVKKNQETLYHTLEKKPQAQPFSPSARGGDASPAPGA